MVANTSETTLSAVAEATPGTTPATPAFQRLRITGEQLAYQYQSEPSPEITDAPGEAEVLFLAASAGGAVNTRLAFGPEFDLIAAHALRGSWGAADGEGYEPLVAARERKSLTLERRNRLPDGAFEFSRYTGAVPNSLQMTFAQGAAVTAVAEMIALGEATASTAITGATYAAPSTTRSIAAPEVAAITVGGVTGTVFYNQIAFTYSNNAAVRNVLSRLGGQGVRYGTPSLEGTLSVLFDADARPLYQRFQNRTEGALQWDAVDHAGNAYRFHLPRTVFTASPRASGERNADVVMEMSFRALLDDATGTLMRILRKPAA